jgi:hypothetical protein
MPCRFRNSCGYLVGHIGLSQAVTGKSLLDNRHSWWLSRNCLGRGPGARGQARVAAVPPAAARVAQSTWRPGLAGARECGDRDLHPGPRHVLRCAGTHRDNRRCPDGTVRLGGEQGAVPSDLGSRPGARTGRDSRGSHACHRPRASPALKNGERSRVLRTALGGRSLSPWRLVADATGTRIWSGWRAGREPPGPLSRPVVDISRPSSVAGDRPR